MHITDAYMWTSMSEYLIFQTDIQDIKSAEMPSMRLECRDRLLPPRL